MAVIVLSAISAALTAFAAIFPVVTAKFTILSVETLKAANSFAVTALLAI